MALGIDVSQYQGKIQWGEVAKSGRKFAICRVADGVKHLDMTFAENAAGAAKAGMAVGGYLFWRAESTPEDQAALLCSQAAKEGWLPPCIDFEHQDVSKLQRKEVRERLLATARKVQEIAGACMIYSSVSWWDIFMRPGDEKGLFLWVAHYGVERPTLPTHWGRYDFWQFTSDGKVPGISGKVDENRFSGDELALRQLCDRVCR